MPKEKNKLNEDKTIDQMLRPQKWEEYVGQEKIKHHLRIMIEASKRRGEAMDHILLCGQAGLGKTTLAYLIAKELNSQIKITSGPALEKMGDMAAILTNLEPNDVLFIDEAHRINRLIEEVLYPAMESRKLHLIIGKGPSARNLTIDLPPFTLIAATTRENLLSQPLRSRFGAIFRLNYYELDDIIKIIKRSAQILNIKITPEALNILARASRATPRVANRLLKRSRDYAIVHNASAITENEARKTLELLEIDELGLEPQDRKLIEIIIKKFNGGPVGLKTLSAALNEDAGVIEDIYEPYLITLGFIQRTSAGRIVLPPAYKHLKIIKQGELLS
jgi:Holliday junction DNA helicase RuvB